MNYTSIKIEGGLISQELLEDITEGRAAGQQPQDFGLDKNRRLIDEIGAVWSDARSYWDAYQRALARLPEADPATTATREQWIRPLLAALGYGRMPFFRAVDIGGRSFAISHRAGDDELAPPIHIEGFNTSLDKRPPSGQPRVSPHALVQEYLNRTDHLWGIVTNGQSLRLLRDSAILSRQCYIEFDLRQLMENERFNEFALFYRLLHRSRLPKAAEDAPECLLEQYHKETVKTGGRVRDHLRDGVEAAIRLLGKELPLQPQNAELAEKLRSGALTAQEYYRQLLRFVYRLLFLMVSEERGLIGPLPRDPEKREIYQRFYSVRRLREIADRVGQGSERHGDLWRGLMVTFNLFSRDDASAKLGMIPLNGSLFAPDSIANLLGAQLPNAHTLEIIRSLSLFQEKRITRRVNYAALDVEELGSVYESLLDCAPNIAVSGERIEFDLLTGTERKSTSSYYTPSELVNELIKSALVPVIQDRLAGKQTKEEKRQALLSISVCDPACGSGHFLLAAARRLGFELARIDSGEELPNPADVRLATREVVRHCIFGVDLNSLAVDLCKVALWIEGHCPEKPLSFLDHRIKQGNSLLGTTPELMKDGLPDEAFKPVTGDVKAVASATAKQNKKERSGQFSLRRLEWEPRLGQLAYSYHNIEELPEDSSADVQGKGRSYQEYLKSGEYAMAKFTADTWCSAFFWPLTDPNELKPTSDRFRRIEANPHDCNLGVREKVLEIAQRQAFFHWQLEFPTIFERGGFDCILGNPPWDRIKLQEEEFFATREVSIAKASNKAARAKLIKQLPETNPALDKEFAAALRAAEGESKFVRQSGRFPLSGRGDVNTYALFSELACILPSDSGQSGIVIPIGIATDDTLKTLFSYLVEKPVISSLHGFENEALIFFPATHHAFKFCLLTITRKEVAATDFVFLCRYPEHLNDEKRHFTLRPEEFALLNPNTHTCPVFRTRADAELTKAIYQRVPVLVKEARGNQTEENPWGAKFLAMFHMANDSGLFKTAADFPSGIPEDYLPLYEAKMMHQFDHRWGTYEGASQAQLNAGILPQPSNEEKRDSTFTAMPRYWVPRSEVNARLQNHTQRQWLIGFRDITSSVVERTAIFSILPRVGVGNNAPLLVSGKMPQQVACLFGSFNSLPFDFVSRTKIAGTHMNFFLLEQLPALSPDRYLPADLEFLLPRVLELTYTAGDLKPFAEDLGYDGPPFTWDEERRALLRAELDAYYANLYDLNRKQLRYILDPHGLSAKELVDILDPWEDPTCAGPHLLPAEPALDFPGETFRVLKGKEEKKHGEYRTRRLVLEAWERMFGC